MKRDIETKLKEAKQLTDIQGDDGNWNYDSYMQGMFNGMECILSIFEERQPKFKNAPEKWLCKGEPKGRNLSEIKGTSPI